MSRSRISSRSKAVTVTVLGPVLAFSLVACGGGSSGSTASAATPKTSATGAPGGGGRGGFGGADFTKIQACLKAAGITLPTRSGFPRPSGSFSPRARPSGVRPSGVRPSGGNFRGGAGGQFASPQVQAALKACGITIPTGGARRPNATPTS
jgi:hypothetical protein